LWSPRVGAGAENVMDSLLEGAAGRSATHARARVLVAEDDEVLANLISEELEELDFEVRIARDGEAALAILDRDDLAVLLVDLGLRHHDGFAVAAHARSRCSDRLAVILMTGRRGPDLDERARAAGCDTILLKPFSINDLHEAVARAR
jgi:DNA-binding response OmpR family regulator